MTGVGIRAAEHRGPVFVASYIGRVTDDGVNDGYHRSAAVFIDRCLMRDLDLPADEDIVACEVRLPAAPQAAEVVRSALEGQEYPEELVHEVDGVMLDELDAYLGQWFPVCGVRGWFPTDDHVVLPPELRAHYEARRRLIGADPDRRHDPDQGFGPFGLPCAVEDQPYASADPVYPRPKGSFYARVSLFGKHELGLCLVLDDRTTPSPMWRLWTPTEGVLLQSPGSVYGMRLVEDADAHAERRAVAAAKRDREARDLARTRERGRRAAERPRRAVEVVVYNDFAQCRVGGLDGAAPEPGIRFADFLLAQDIHRSKELSRPALSCGLEDSLIVRRNSSATPMREVVDSVRSGLTALGFSTFNVRTATQEEQQADDDIPF